MTETAALGRAAVRGVGWGALATGVNLTAQIGFMAVMARLLDPAAFGLVAMAHIACRFGSYFAQLGLAPALVQRPVLGPLDVRVALTLALLLGGGFAAAVALAAPVAAWFFKTPELVALLRVLALGLLIGALGGVPLALLRRALRFRAVAAVEVSAYVLGYGAVGVACALAGLGVWSLVAASLGQGLVVLMAASVLTRLPLRPAWDGVAARSLWAYGGRHSLTGFLEFVGLNLENLLVGRVLGAGTLGLWSRAQLLVQLPAEQGAGVCTRALFPALARLQGGPALGALALRAGMWIGMCAAGLGAGLAVCAPDVVAVLLGPGWAAAAAPLRVLALALPLFALTQLAGTVLDAVGMPGAKLRAQMITLALRVPALLIAVPFGLRAVAVLALAGEGLRCALYVAAARGRIAAASRDVAAVAGWTLLAGVAVAGAALGMQAMLPVSEVVPRLMAATAAGAPALLVVAAGARRRLGLAGLGCDSVRDAVPGNVPMPAVRIP